MDSLKTFFNLKKLNNLQKSLASKVYYLKLRSTVNNIYITLTDNFGVVLFVKSAGSLEINKTKWNSSFMLELLLQDFLKYIQKLKLFYFILNLDIINLKKRKVILKFLKSNNIKILYIKLATSKAFNGVRSKKRRRT